MKNIFTSLLVISFAVPLLYSCSGSRLGRYTLTEGDASLALKQMLEAGARSGVSKFSKDSILKTIFPGQLGKALNTIQVLGLSSDVDRFTASLASASEKTASASIPVFVNSINRLSFADAIRIVRSGNTAATDYLRSSSGIELRNAIKPVMQEAMDQYKLTEQWNKIMKPAQAALGGKLSLDLPTLMAGMVSETMFNKIEEQEITVRTHAEARTTDLMQKVFK